MAIQTFTWAPDFQSTGEYQPNVKVNSFGDGYEQRVAFGINTNPSKWTLYFTNRTDSEAIAIDAFLQAAGGVASFLWTPPGEGLAKKFVCRKWTKAPTAGNGVKTGGVMAFIWTINATFDEVYEA